MSDGPAKPTVMIALFEVIVLLESLAVIVALPLATPVTTPVPAPTVAIDGLADRKLKVPPKMKNPFASLPRASNATVPVGAIVAEVGERSIAVSTWRTLSNAAPLMPWALAEMLVEPFAAAVARTVTVKVESIAATDAFDEPKMNVIPAIATLSVSYAVALYDRERPSAAIVNVSLTVVENPAESRDTTIRVIGVRTFNVATPTTAPDVART